MSWKTIAMVSVSGFLAAMPAARAADNNDQGTADKATIKAGNPKAGEAAASAGGAGVKGKSDAGSGTTAKSPDK